MKIGKSHTNGCISKDVVKGFFTLVRHFHGYIPLIRLCCHTFRLHLEEVCVHYEVAVLYHVFLLALKHRIETISALQQGDIGFNGRYS